MQSGGKPLNLTRLKREADDKVQCYRRKGERIKLAVNNREMSLQFTDNFIRQTNMLALNKPAIALLVATFKYSLGGDSAR